MDILQKKVGRLMYWKTKDGRFSGVIIEPFTMTSMREKMEMPAAVLLAVPLRDPREKPSINKYSPLILEADSVEKLGPMLEEWTDEHKDEDPWDLRLK